MKTGSRLDRTLWPAVILLAVVFAVFELLPVDIRLQDFFYDFHQETWLIDARNPALRNLFYNWPRDTLLAFGGLLFILLIRPSKWRPGFLQEPAPRRAWLVVLLSLATAPLLISGAKLVTHVFCPYELTRYGGAERYIPVFERYTKDNRPLRFGRGFPAGHASGGYALLSLAGVWKSRRGRFAGLMIGLGLGTAMGAYQMLRGAHFLSHTLVSALVCWIIFLLWRRAIIPLPVPDRAGSMASDPAPPANTPRLYARRRHRHVSSSYPGDS